MKIRIKNRFWKVEILKTKEYEERYPDHTHTLALTVYNHERNIRYINFCGKPSYSTIKHEVMHAFLSDRNFRDVSYGEIEEQVCDEVGENLERIERVAKKILARAA